MAGKIRTMKIKYVDGTLFFYERRLAKKGELCFQPVHGATWVYNPKDPGSGRENVVLFMIKKPPTQWWVKYGHWCKTSWKNVLTGKHRGNQLKLVKS